MKQLIALVEKIYQSKRMLSGRLHIYNLFNLQNASSNIAINQYEDLVHAGKYDTKESLVTIGNYNATHGYYSVGEQTTRKIMYFYWKPKTHG